jgi:uncharacterized protein
VSEKLPSREQAIQLLHKSQCSAKVIRHCKAVANLALKTAEALKKRGYSVNSELVEIGALLHDIGRSKTHTVQHAIVGVEIAQAAGLPEPVISIIRRHVGGGITLAEAAELGWPRDESYVPLTFEEKIVSYADKLVEGSKNVPVEKAIEHLSREFPEAAVRVRKLHDEIAELVGDICDNENVNGKNQ